MKKNVLVFPCGSEIGLEIHRSVSSSTHFKLIGGSSHDDHGKYVYESYVNNIPFVDDSNFIEHLNKIIKENNIDYIFPAHDSVVLRLAQAKSRMELACEVITSPIETCEITRSKGETYKKFISKIPTPVVYENSDYEKLQFPVFLKPDVGQGSKGTQLVSNQKELDFYIEKDPSLLVLEYLPGKEYTIDCFTDAKGRLLFCEGRERARISNGISVSSNTVSDSRFAKLAEVINTNLIFKGVWFFQVKENREGELVLMEIAPRVAGTMGLERARGVNLPLLSLFAANGYDTQIFMNSYNVTIDRALENRYKHNIHYEHVYIDFDDLIIFNGKVNPTIISYLYQCLNNGKVLHLITRHKANLENTLAKYRLTNIFDELILVKDDEEKAAYITDKNAIFIDDSFAERKKVYDICGIPVFDAHMVESLMETT